MKRTVPRNGSVPDGAPATARPCRRRQEAEAFIAAMAADPEGRAQLGEVWTALLAMQEALATPGVPALVGLDPAAVEELLLAVEAARRGEAICPGPDGGAVQGLPGGARGGGSMWIELKYIRGPNGRMYGPYPYLRWRGEDGRKHSRYLGRGRGGRGGRLLGGRSDADARGFAP